MLNFRYISVGFVLVVVALFGWFGASYSAKGVTDSAKSVAGDPKGLITSLPVSQRVELLIDEAVTTCKEFGGEFDVGVLDAQTIQLRGEAGLITVIDEGSFSCSAGASIYCGSGGCAVHFLSSQYTLTMQLQSWEQNPNGIRLGLHGAACGQVGAVPCYKELTLLEGSFYVE